MKYLRLLLFIPSTFVAMILANILYSLLLYIVSYIYSDPSELSFIWESFLKSFIVTIVSIYVGIYIYPFEKKLPALIALTLFYIIILILLFVVYNQLLGYIKDSLEAGDIKPESLLNQIGITVGNIIGIGFMWRQLYKNEL